MNDKTTSTISPEVLAEAKAAAEECLKMDFMGRIVHSIVDIALAPDKVSILGEDFQPTGKTLFRGSIDARSLCAVNAAVWVLHKGAEPGTRNQDIYGAAYTIIDKIQGDRTTSKEIRNLDVPVFEADNISPNGVKGRPSAPPSR